MTSLSARLIGKVPFGPLKRVRKFLVHPGEAQDRVLRDLLSRAALTEWGQRYGFAELLETSDVRRGYRERVPVHTYDDMRDAVASVRKGKPNVLWPGKIRHFAVSSGTTSSGRVVPVSQAMIRSNRRFSLAVILNYLEQTGRLNLLAGKVLALPGWIEDDNPHLGTRIGQISAVLADTQPRILKPWQAIPIDLGQIREWQQKMAAIADHVLSQDIRVIVIAPSWCQVLFQMVVDRDFALTGARRSIGEIWPNLGLIVTGGVALSGYRDTLLRYIDREGVDLVETYGASEGFVSFQDDLSDSSMLLHLDNEVFMEFLPLDSELKPGLASQRLSIDEVSVGPDYEILLTSNSGFWSYAVGDVIRFTSLSPHRIIVVGRTVDMLDKYGEAVFGEAAREAIVQAAQATQSEVLQFHVTHVSPEHGGTPAHDWLIEFEKLPVDLDAFSGEIDRFLAGAGHHYHDRREGGAFGPPVITPLKPGSFYKSLEKGGKRITVQTKVPMMREERDFADAVLYDSITE